MPPLAGQTLCCQMHAMLTAALKLVQTPDVQAGQTQGTSCAPTSQYQQYVNTNCERKCTAWNPKARCIDNSQCVDSVTFAGSCASWASSGYCATSSQYYGFMKANCAATCKMDCSSTAPAVDSAAYAGSQCPVAVFFPLFFRECRDGAGACLLWGRCFFSEMVMHY